MTPPNSRYDRLSDLGEAHGDAPVFADETWIQAPDGSWLRSTDKAAQKLIRKGKVKVAPPTQAAVPPPPSAPPSPPAPPAVSEPKRRLGRKSAEREKDAELVRQVEREREERRALELKIEAERQAAQQAEAERQAALERERQAEMERRHQAELDRKAELERQSHEMARQAEMERARAAELEREIERERSRVAELERQVGLKQARKKAPPSKLDDTGAYFREPGQLTTHWPDDRPVSAPPLAAPMTVPMTAAMTAAPVTQPGKHAPKSKPKKEPKPKAPAKIRPARGRTSTGKRIVNGAMTLGLVFATLMLGAAINWLGPDAAHALRPFTESGGTGKPLDVREFTLTVQTAKAASALQVGKAAVPTQGAWVIVHISVAATKEPTHIGYAALRDKSGRTFLATDRIVQPLLDGTRTFQPGIGLQGDVVFEVPKEALPDLTVLFAAQPDHLGMDALASVDLPPLTLAGDAPAALAATEVKP